MDIRLFSIESAPKTLPVWELILDDLGRPPAHRIAKTLGIGLSTVYRWNKEGHAPKMACLALFWLTRWGRSEVDCRATNDAMTAVSLARSLGEERAALRGQLAQSEYERDRLASMVSRFQTMARESVGHGNAAIAHHSHTGSHFAGSWALGTLPWTYQPAPPRAPVVGAPGCSQEIDRSADRGSPAAPPPGAHSGIYRADARSSPPQPSSPPVAEPSSPSVPREWCQSDAIMASPVEASPGLLELRQAPRSARALSASLRSAQRAKVPHPQERRPGHAATSGISCTAKPVSHVAHAPRLQGQTDEPLATWGSAPVPALKARSPHIGADLTAYRGKVPALSAPAPTPARSAFATLAATLTTTHHEPERTAP